jgi:hypothetical protein
VKCLGRLVHARQAWSLLITRPQRLSSRLGRYGGVKEAADQPAPAVGQMDEAD